MRRLLSFVLVGSIFAVALLSLLPVVVHTPIESPYSSRIADTMTPLTTPETATRQPSARPPPTSVESQRLGVAETGYGAASGDYSRQGYAAREVEILAQFEDGFRASSRARKIKAVTNLWHRAADIGGPDAALVALGQAVMDPDPAVNSVAEEALDDLHRLRDALARVPERLGQGGMTIAASFAPDGAATTSEVYEILAEKERRRDEVKIAELSAVLYSVSDPTSRGETIKQLLGIRRHESVAVVKDAVFDAEETVRAAAVEALWYATADGLDQDDDAVRVLALAAQDGSTRVVALAVRALEDLERLRNSSAETRDHVRADNSHGGTAIRDHRVTNGGSGFPE